MNALARGWERLGVLPHLRRLLAAKCGLDDALPTSLISLARLTLLELSQSPTAAKPGALAWLSALAQPDTLCLRDCSLRAVPAELATLHTLHELRLDGNTGLSGG